MSEVVWGNFEWTDGEGSPVKFVPCEDGQYLLFSTPQKPIFWIQHEEKQPDPEE